MKNRLLAIILAFFAGTFGVHRFYLGQYGKGFLYLMFCWTFIPTLFSWIDIFRLVLMSDYEFDDRYNFDVYDQYDELLDDYEEDPYRGRMSLSSLGRRKSNYSQADEIEKLHNLMVRGIISEREFETRKNQL